MRKSSAQILGLFVPLTAVVALIVLLMFALTRLAQIQHDMRSNVSANMLWVITQTQVEGLRVNGLFERHLREGGQTTDLVQAYQLLSSRFSLLSAGPQLRYLQEIERGPELISNIRTVRDAAAAVSLNAAGNVGSAEQFLHALGDLNKTLAVVASRTMVAQWEETGSRLDRYRDGVLTIIFLLLGICACSFIISTHLFIALRRVRESEWAKRQALQLQSQLDAERQVSELHRNFGAMVSHQFRTPLAIIDSSMQRILRQSDQIDRTQLVRRVQKVRRATSRLARLVEHTRIADQYSELLDVNLEACDLPALIESIVQQQHEIGPKRHINVVVPSDTVPKARCDPMLVEHVVFNFLSNAVKYSSSETDIRVSVFEKDGHVCCEVRDWGKGISEHELPYLFDRYFRGQDVDDIPGTGMGLYVAYKLAQVQGGFVDFSSNPEGGSIFKVCFPVVHTTEPEQCDATSADRQAPLGALYRG